MKNAKHHPPRFLLRFFRWYCHPKLQDYIEGDLMEVYKRRVNRHGKRKADLRFGIDVLLLFRSGIIRPVEGYRQVNTFGMYRSYFKIGWRNVWKHKGYSFINVAGLALGIVITILIGLWINDELSFNKYHKNYEAIAQVWSGDTDSETMTVEGSFWVQYPVGQVLRSNYSQYFKNVSTTYRIGDCTVSTGDKKLTRTGLFVEENFIDMFSLEMLQGSGQSLHDRHSVIISASTAKAIFGDDDPLDKTLTIDNQMDVTVTGVYEDLPRNSSFNEIQIFFPMTLLPTYRAWMAGKDTDWDNHIVWVYVQLNPNVSMEAVSAAIRDLYSANMPEDFYAAIKDNQPFVQLIPMHTWHLYSEFKDGQPAGGRITYVWLFGIVGVFVLMLACINFINLSTARSEKRAREVGVRKVVGSRKGQLIMQFLCESWMVVTLAFILAIALLVMLQNSFNELADKDIALPFGSIEFWGMALVFILAAGFVSGLYPAFYLSAFQPVKVLKGFSRIGRFAVLPRKVLVVIQFTVSVVLIMGTLIVYLQIQHARNRPVGYDRESLVSVELSDPNFEGKYEVLRAALVNTGVVSEVARSSSPLTIIWTMTGGYTWPGRNPNADASFVVCNVSPDFGRTVGWEVVSGRDFSGELTTDTTDAIIINEAAAKYMGLENPIGQKFTDVDEFGRPEWSKTIIGVVKDIIMASPFAPVGPTIYYFDDKASSILHIKLNSGASAPYALSKIEAALSTIAPAALLDFKFVDEEYAQKFSQEVRVGRLSGVFAVLAIIISCLGLFGLASFVAEQRTKEIGIRKVAGASVVHLWKMLCKDFVVLVIISCCVAIPIAYYFLTAWLEKYEYRTDIPLWVWGAATLGALVVTLLTVSYQTIKAATVNPVKSLRSE